MENNKESRPRRQSDSRIWSGLILLAAGLLLLAYKMGLPVPGWLFTWPMILIVIGLISGLKNGFRNPGTFIMILIGSIFLVDNNIPEIDLHDYIIPIILMAIGLLFLLKPKGGECSHSRRRRHVGSIPRSLDNAPPDNTGNAAYASGTQSEPEYLDVNAVFGGIKKRVLSKNFRGGSIVCFMGGSEIDLMQADMQQPIELDVNNVFGGTKIVIPAHWDIQNEVSAIFGGVEDKRMYANTQPDPNKKIYLKGTCVFGGIEISNY